MTLFFIASEPTVLSLESLMALKSVSLKTWMCTVRGSVPAMPCISLSRLHSAASGTMKRRSMSECFVWVRFA